MYPVSFGNNIYYSPQRKINSPSKKSYNHVDLNQNDCSFLLSNTTKIVTVTLLSMLALKAPKLMKNILGKFKNKKLQEDVSQKSIQDIIKPACDETNKTNVKSNPILIKKDQKLEQLESKTPKVHPSQLSDKERLTNIFKKLSFVWNKDGEVSPKGIDEILSRHVGPFRTREIGFFSDPARGLYDGRKKSYKMKSGSIFVLESHLDMKRGVITRCYMSVDNKHEILDKHHRAYLSSDGDFAGETYFSPATHLSSSSDAYEWIKQKTVTAPVNNVHFRNN